MMREAVAVQELQYLCEARLGRWDSMEAPL